jgi:HAE1 family hydrophobic/amphiphilic exporter-1
MSNFFINRPIVAMVIAILTVIVGAVAIATLPVSQFPNIVPPEIQLLATYVGADARTLEQSVATPIEQQINGVDNMNYMYSLNATGNSQTTVVVNFDDRDKALKQGVAVSDVYRTIQAYMGGLFINYFNDFGRQWQVYVEAEAQYRSNGENLGQFFVRNGQGEMVPLSALANFSSREGPEFTMRYNEYRSAQINGSAAPGYSSDQATAALEDVFKKTMPHEMGFDYMGMSYQEQKARQGVPPSVIFAFSLAFVFLILAALYESWTLPFSVLLSTPVAIFGAFAVLWLRRALLSIFEPAYMVQIESDVYSQIGLVMLIGLAAKNAILIVEFAKDEHEKGKALVDAALEGAKLRLRPILMTSSAFILGCVPLWTASGAGSVARQVMGTTVIGGMLAASAIGIFFVPAIYYLVERFSASTADNASPMFASPQQGD